ncbi:methyltransferase domain-containing protein [Embleya sp. NBC_00896]|uniref:methyltransferase domain-containing protein n=1 Tax=Embleya sp. NBC_00896 TaxID=2975961 RepID=UPI003866F732|nr:methyltransferase domain-containing protein [Embleya sp. NBC_00896]
MTSTASEQARVNAGLLRLVEERTGSLAQQWRDAFLAVPRHRFLPDVVWVRRRGERVPERIDRRASPDAWFAAAYQDVSVIVQLNDGAEAGPNPVWPSSSASQPTVVAGMLLALDVRDGHRVLEIGTGSGWNAGLLAHRLGADRVVTVELDRALAVEARRRLTAIGPAPRVVTGDGAEGWANGSPYDRVLCTCSVERVPAPWIAQTRTGGRIVTPWATSWTADGSLVLTTHQDGSAVGPFVPGGAFMRMRAHRTGRIDDLDDVVRPEHVPDSGTTTVSPWDVTGDADFAIGVAVPRVWHLWEPNPGLDGVHTRIWVADEAGSSWACVDYDGAGLAVFAVRQYGPRRLWDEVAAAWTWWDSAHRPGLDRFGVSVRPDGTQIVWHGSPGGPSWPVPLA